MIGIGNQHRRDDGVGPAIVADVARQHLPRVRVINGVAETTAILDAWAGMRLAVVVDAAAGDSPGRVRRVRLDQLAESASHSSHPLSLRQAFELARVLERAPDQVVVVTVDVTDTGHGEGLSPAVSAALPEAVGVVLGVLAEQFEESAHQPP